MKTFCTLLGIALLVLGYRYWNRPITYPPGVLIAVEPQQADETDAPPIHYKQFTLKPLAHFAVEARLLHSHVYRYDRAAALVPVDLALGWGRMSDQSVLDRMKITQSMRFYWFWDQDLPISKEEVISHSSNVHVIPATREIASRCKSLRQGTLVRLNGELVEASGPEIGTWRSSLSRTDTGNGACELMWVTEVTELTPPERFKVAQR